MTATAALRGTAHTTLSGAGALIRRVPLSLIALAAIWMFKLLDPEKLAVTAPYRLTDWHILTSGLSSLTATGAGLATVALLVFALPAELALGTRRFGVGALLLQLVATPVGMMAALAIEQSGFNRWGADLSAGALLSPVPWILGIATVAAGRMPLPWGRRVTAATVALSCTLTLYGGRLADVVGLTAVVLALAARRTPWNALARMSVHETRIVVATVLACITLGPLATQLDPYAGGPLAESGFFAWTELTGHVSWIIVNLVIIAGLIRGRRLAWWLALAANLAAAIVVASRVTLVVEETTLGDLAQGLPETTEAGEIATSPGLSVEVVINLLLIVLPWLAAVVLLLLCRKAFVAGVNRGKLKLLGLVVAAAVVLAAVFGHPTVFVASASVVAYAVLMSVPELSRSRDRDRARAILDGGSGDHLQQMTLWDGNRYWFDPEGWGFVAYRVSHGVAVTVGEPVRATTPRGPADAEARAAIARGFEEFVSEQGWAIAWYSVAEAFSQDRQKRGFRRLHVADESILKTSDAEFRGKRFQNIRTARNHAKKAGVTARWLSWESATVIDREKITELSEQWADTKALPEMGFTLGGLAELADADTRILVAVDEEGRFHGVTSWLPVRTEGRVVGMTLDMMRRDAQGFRPVIEFLLSEALLAAAAEGQEWISLSGAPLATSSAAEGLLDRALNAAGGVIEPLYGFRSLAASKHKFHPEQASWYLLYDDEAQLPAIGLAVCSCYLPGLKIRDAVSAMRALQRAGARATRS